MKCIRCGSPRIVKFVDAFGYPRVYCEDCHFNVSIDTFRKLILSKDLFYQTWRRK